MNRGAELLKAAQGTQGQKAKRLEVSQPFVCALASGKKVPGDDLRRKASKIFGIPVGAWDQRISDAPPPSGEVPAPAAPGTLPNPDDGRSVIDRARTLLAYLAVPGRTPTELAQAREIRSALTLEARLVGALAVKQKLAEHPDFPGFVEALIAEVGALPGGLEAIERACDRLEESADDSASRAAA